MRFTKMQGAGNDFIIIDIDKENICVSQLPNLAKVLCQRRISIGADGLMAVTKPEKDGNFKMLFYNSDGTEGEMCGNGSRCVARYGYENGLAGEKQHIETISGMVTGTRISESFYRVRLNDPTVIDMSRNVRINDSIYECTYIEMGKPGLPHAVTELDFSGMSHNELRELGRSLRWHNEFPKGANVTFYYFTGKNKVNALTFERGVEDFTLACGTGAASTAIAAALKGSINEDALTVDMPGGELQISLRRINETVCDIYLMGPTNIVAVGEIPDEHVAAVL